MNEKPSGRLEAGLYVVATPIGHLSDLSRRAADVLRNADLVAAEDTRTSRVLLDSIGASTPMIAAHEHNEQAAAEEIVARAAAGEAIALVCDAGTPGISDPGARIVRAARAAGIATRAIPGPSAAAAMVSIAGLHAESFRFVGFLPSKAKARAERIATWRDADDAVVLYESPHRIAATLAAIATVLGADRRIVIGRELTKRFEESIALPAGDATAWLEADPNRSRGEFVIAIDAAPARAAAPESAVRIEMPLDTLLATLLEHAPPSRASRLAHALTGRPRRTLYERLLVLAEDASPED
ncbi:MAG: 16S rRNA (cytidine(1402)-2'-O)-methyltransferase [Burkholderiaceae bacterium]